MPKGYKPTKKHRENISKALKKLGIKPPGFKGKKHTEEAKKKVSEANKGNKYWLGKKHTEKSKKKMGEAQRGEKSWRWRGGISFEPYTTDWTEDLKRAIRKRDKYTCQLCGKEPAIDVHHIDYNKKNCSPDNLITLCRSCHGKTLHNRNYWTNYFKEVG